jgi:D-glycero-alpha-D-manno-heptose-7-phosphate kinase
MPSIRKHLEDGSVSASAPCRVDSGGTWDIKALALPSETVRPVTVNMAVTLRTRVTLAPFDDGWIRISSQGFQKPEIFRRGRCPYASVFGLYFAAVSHFDFHGLQVDIRSQAPVKSALGGSSTAVVALIKALGKVSARLGGERVDRGKLLRLAYHLEDGINGGYCGMQDQAAAVYGGVHLWEWRYSAPGVPFTRTPLLNAEGEKALSDRLLVAYSGKSHASMPTNRKWVREFLSGKTREAWIEANAVVRRFAGALQDRHWRMAGKLLREEMALRRRITPEALSPVTGRLVDQAEEAGCGARFAGAGAGGSLWAIGEASAIGRLRLAWRQTLASVPGAGILDCRIDPRGVV